MGVILFQVIVHTDGTVDGYIPLGALMAWIVTAIFEAIMVMVGISLYFNLEISMGSTRRSFFVTFYTGHILMSVMSILMITAFCAAEEAFGRAVYPDFSKRFNLLPYLLKFGVLSMLAVIMVSGFCGILVMRYGRKMGWILWILWMLGFVGIPRVIDAAKASPDSVFGIWGNRFMECVSRTPFHMWMAMGVLAGVCCLAGSYVLIRKQQVTG